MENGATSRTTDVFVVINLLDAWLPDFL